MIIYGLVGMDCSDMAGLHVSVQFLIRNVHFFPVPFLSSKLCRHHVAHEKSTNGIWTDIAEMLSASAAGGNEIFVYVCGDGQPDDKHVCTHLSFSCCFF